MHQLKATGYMHKALEIDATASQTIRPHTGHAVHLGFEDTDLELSQCMFYSEYNKIIAPLYSHFGEQLCSHRSVPHVAQTVQHPLLSPG